MQSTNNPQSLQGKGLEDRALFPDIHNINYVTSGRLDIQTATDTPHIPLYESPPNEKLIKSFSIFLTEFGKENDLVRLGSTLWLVVKSPIAKLDGFRLMICSRPFNGVSYVHAIAVRNYSDTQINFSFVATTSLQMASKLKEFCMLDIAYGFDCNCSNLFGCVGDVAIGKCKGL